MVIRVGSYWIKLMKIQIAVVSETATAFRYGLRFLSQIIFKKVPNQINPISKLLMLFQFFELFRTLFQLYLTSQTAHCHSEPDNSTGHRQGARLTLDTLVPRSASLCYLSYTTHNSTAGSADSSAENHILHTHNFYFFF